MGKFIVLMLCIIGSALLGMSFTQTKPRNVIVRDCWGPTEGHLQRTMREYILEQSKLGYETKAVSGWCHELKCYGLVVMEK